MPLTFVHLSDLHNRQGRPEQDALVEAAFFKDIAIQLKDTLNPYLVFSGDLVRDGADLAAWEHMRSHYDDALAQVQLPKQRRICVPGNHDISRQALKPLLLLHEGALSLIRNETQFNDQLPTLTSAVLSPKFTNYVAHEAAFAAHTCCQKDIGGTGWQVTDDCGIYCLNTALCSSAGLLDDHGEPMRDQNRLHVDTRSLHAWLTNTDLASRVLVMHHPLDWLSEWARTELETIIANSFDLVLSGHVHAGLTSFWSRGPRGCAQVTAPPLFTDKVDVLGYSLVQFDPASKAITIRYRQWVPSHHCFVAGTTLAGTDTGVVNLPRVVADITVSASRPTIADTGTTLGLEFDEALTCYSSMRPVWIERDLSETPETSTETTDATMFAARELAHALRSCVIRAPKEFGLTVLGRYLALEHFRASEDGPPLLMINSMQVSAHPRGIADAVSARCDELGVVQTRIAGFVLDNWRPDKAGRRVLAWLREAFQSLPIILLQGLDTCADIATNIEWAEGADLPVYYLWALSRQQVRMLVSEYLVDDMSLDDDIVTNKILADLVAINIHRTPLNCLLMLKLLEQAFDDSPVNRTELIGRVLYLLFHRFDGVPRYATRPDLKDCEYALGYVAEWLIRSGRARFRKAEFYKKVQEYCDAQILDLECDVLFAFLVGESIIVRRGIEFEFRFVYWMYYFAAHRMHHSSEFAQYVFADGRYSAFPEVVEFYAGIDRRRTDAVETLTADLSRMDDEFEARTGMPLAFNPFEEARWIPSTESIERMHSAVSNGMAASSMPKAIKDAVADEQYDRARPYNQQVAAFISESSLVQLMQAMRGAARALRNSDHVPPAAKLELMNQVMRCWVRMCQVVVLVSHLLAENRIADFEDARFILADKARPGETALERWERIMSTVPDNVVQWFEEDVFSKKLGALFGKYLEQDNSPLAKLLVVLVLIRQRPPGWEKEVGKYIAATSKNSYYLFRVYEMLGREQRLGFASEGGRQQLSRLEAMAVAKHKVGATRPSAKLTAKVEQQLKEHRAKGKGRDE